MTTSGDFSRVFANGYEITQPDSNKWHYVHDFNDNKAPYQNIGVEQHAPGVFKPTFTLDGYTRTGQGALTAHNVLYQNGPGNAQDNPYLITCLAGNDQSPVIGDYAVNFYGTRMSYTATNQLTGIATFNATFQPRGLRHGLFPVLLYDNPAINTATNFSTTAYDDGTAFASGTSQGGVAVLQVYNTTPVNSVGTFTFTGVGTAADTFSVTIAGTAYTFTLVAALTGVAGQVLIGASAAATAQNAWYAMVGALDQAGIAYTSNTVPLPQNFLTAPVYVTISGAVITVTAANSQNGITGNTGVVLAKTSTAITVVTNAGGVAGDTYTITIGSATTSGGSYTTFATFTAVGATHTALRVEVPVGTVINEWLKVTCTKASGAGTVQTIGFNVTFGRICLA